MKITFLCTNSICFVYDDVTKCVEDKYTLDCEIDYMKINIGNTVRLKAEDTREIWLNLDNIWKSKEYVRCYLSFANKFRVEIMGIKCGEVADRWISRCVLDSFNGKM